MATVVIQERERNIGKRYCIYFKDPFTGKRKYYKTVRKKREADKMANDLRYLIDNGKLPEASKSNRKARLLTLAEVAEEQVYDWEARCQNKEIKPETAHEYIRRTRRIAKEAIGKKLLCELTTDELKAFRDNIAQTTSNVSANRSLFVIKQVIRKGLELNAIPEDPVKSIRSLSEKDHKRNNFQLPHEIDTLVEASQQTKAKYYMPVVIYLGVEHGYSKQEILYLRDDDVNLTFGGRGIIRRFRTKNRFENTEYLMPRTREALIKWREHLEFMRHRKKIVPVDNFVICHLDGTQKKGFDSAWKKIKEIAGFDDLHFHDNRHTFCSNVALSGGELKDISEMIGHSDISMTDRYTHLTGLRKLYRQEKLAEHYANANVDYGYPGEHIGNTKPIFVPKKEISAK